MGTADYDITAYQPVLYRAESIDEVVEVVGGFFGQASDEGISELDASVGDVAIRLRGGARQGVGRGVLLPLGQVELAALYASVERPRGKPRRPLAERLPPGARLLARPAASPTSSTGASARAWR